VQIECKRLKKTADSLYSCFAAYEGAALVYHKHRKREDIWVWGTPVVFPIVF